jgi:hypothetical protein
VELTLISTNLRKFDKVDLCTAKMAELLWLCLLVLAWPVNAQRCEELTDCKECHTLCTMCNWIIERQAQEGICISKSKFRDYNVRISCRFLSSCHSRDVVRLIEDMH